MSEKSTFVINISGDTEDGVAELDPEASVNLDADGKVKSKFLPGEEAVFIVNLPPGYSIPSVDGVIVRRTCGGATVEPGTVTRTRNESFTFTEQSPDTDLAFYPSTAPVVTLFTVPVEELKITWSEKKITARDEELPVVGKIEYDALCQQVTFTPPSSLVLTDETEEFQVALDIRTVKV